MNCTKCGNAIGTDQMFCTNCGEKVVRETINTEVKKNNNIEETSAKIVSEVTGTVNTIVEKGAQLTEKIKKDENINKAVNNIKANPNTVKIIAAAASVLVVLLIGVFILGRSTPTKTVKSFAKGIEKMKIETILDATNFESTMKKNAKLEQKLYGTKVNVKTYMDEYKLEMQMDLIDDLSGKVFQVTDIRELAKIGSYAEVRLAYTVFDGDDLDMDEMDLKLVKESGKWRIDMNNFGYWY